MKASVETCWDSRGELPLGASGPDNPLASAARFSRLQPCRSVFSLMNALLRSPRVLRVQVHGSNSIVRPDDGKLLEKCSPPSRGTTQRGEGESAWMAARLRRSSRQAPPASPEGAPADRASATGSPGSMSVICACRMSASLKMSATLEHASVSEPVSVSHADDSLGVGHDSEMESSAEISDSLCPLDGGNGSEIICSTCTPLVLYSTHRLTVLYVLVLYSPPLVRVASVHEQSMSSNQRISYLSYVIKSLISIIQHIHLLQTWTPGSSKYGGGRPGVRQSITSDVRHRTATPGP